MYIPKEGEKYTAQLRYHGEKFSCTVHITKKTTTVVFQKGVSAPSGQSCVVYNNDICMGGGIVR